MLEPEKITALRQRTYQFFTQPKSPSRQNFLTSNDVAFSLIEINNQTQPIKHFSPFIAEHQDAAARIWIMLENIMKDRGDEGLEAVLDKVETLKSSENHDLLNYAFMVFATHHSSGRILTIPPLEIRNPEKAFPSVPNGEFVEANADPYENILKWYREDPLINEHHEHWHVVFPIFGLNPDSSIIPAQDRRGELFFHMHRQMLARYECERSSAGLAPVLAFDDFDADIEVGAIANKFLRGQFDSFHLPYADREPNRNLKGITWPGDPTFGSDEMTKRKIRIQAIIDTEQILMRTIDHDVFTAISGINAELSFLVFQDLDKNGYLRGHRAASETIWADEGYITEAFDALLDANAMTLSQPFLQYKLDIYNILKRSIRFEKFPLTLENLNLFASLIEVNPFSPEGANRNHNNYYGNHHGSGHNLPTQINAANDNNGGMIGDNTVDIRDPYFFKWHKHIDGFYQRWQDKLPPYDFSEDAPNVLIRSGGTNYTPDIILCMNKDFPGSESEHFDGFREGEYAFGNQQTDNPWEQDFSARTFSFKLGKNGCTKMASTTETLETFMAKRTIVYKYKDSESDPVVKEVSSEIEYLNHQPFMYFIRVENKELWRKKITVRIFLVPLDKEEHRELWIEMDKFVDELKAKQKKVIFRSDQLSAIIRKPAVTDPTKTELLWQGFNEPVPDRIDGGEIQNWYYCDCGWPYSVLLPRGKKDGESYKLMVMVTDWELDRVGEDECCGSMSYCGSRDRYPDKRPMGYPFDRPFSPSSGVANTISGTPNMASRVIKIKWIDE